MSSNLLQEIQTLQFSDKARAEQLLTRFVRETFSLDVMSVELRPLAVSLNSFNGFLYLADGQKLFFKTHTEPDSVIGEYYNSKLLSQANYPIIQPVYFSTEADKQLLIYETIDDPSVFDIAWAIERGKDDSLEALTDAQNRADDLLFELYLNTLAEQRAGESAAAAIHQLFYHRLTGGRLKRFYGQDFESMITLPDGVYSMRQLGQIHWVINNQHYTDTLGDIIQRAVQLLKPGQGGPAVIGHGDAHNGNVFYNRPTNSLIYFDPAFAGKHHPLLDLTKPLFHNVFAMWMYFPYVKQQEMHISVRQSGTTWYVDYAYTLHPIREMFLSSKVNRVLIPTLKTLLARNLLRADWRAYLKSALFCCPFLTMNLTDGEKFPPAISLLGLTMAIEMGAESHRRRSIIDRILDEAAAKLG
jgi:hypothetical protein